MVCLPRVRSDPDKLLLSKNARTAAGGVNSTFFSARHPGRGLPGPIARRHPKTGRTHREVADEIPYKADYLNDSRE